MLEAIEVHGFLKGFLAWVPGEFVNATLLWPVVMIPFHQ